MRCLGLDFGDKTIGVAVACANNRVATGITTIRRSQPEALRPSINHLSEIIDEYKVTHIVLGYPINMDGSVSTRAEKTLAFKDKLRRNFKSIQVELWDERLSTQAVSRGFFADSKTSKKKRKTYRTYVDEMAAVYILQGYLATLQNNLHKRSATVLKSALKKLLEETMENDANDINMPEDADDVILMNDEDGNEYQLHVLATKEGDGCAYLLAAVAEDEDDTSEVLHFKCETMEEDVSEDDEMALELVDETHADFELVMELFKNDYEELGIIIDEED